VLVIEDNPQDRELVGAFLDATRFEIQNTEAGGLGLSAATAQVPDVILLDLRLPDLDGYEVCRRLRREAQTQNVPVVIVSASDDPALNRLAYAAGAQACLPKPFRKEALVTAIEAVLAGIGQRTSPAKRRKDTARAAEPIAMAWETLGTYRGSLIWAKQLGGTDWAAAVTSLPSPSEGRSPAIAPPYDMVFSEKFASRAGAEASAKRHIDREHERQAQREFAEGGEHEGDSGTHPGQRRFTRYPVSLPVIGLAPQLDRGEILGEVRTVSVGGLMVEFPVELSPSSVVDLALLTQSGPLEVEAQIVWTATTMGTIRHGLAFQQPKSPDFVDVLYIPEVHPEGRDGHLRPSPL
jgi:CheY-like chemotaxis protein